MEAWHYSGAKHEWNVTHFEGRVAKDFIRAKCAVDTDYTHCPQLMKNVDQMKTICQLPLLNSF